MSRLGAAFVEHITFAGRDRLFACHWRLVVSPLCVKRCEDCVVVQSVLCRSVRREKRGVAVVVQKSAVDEFGILSVC